MTEDTGDNRRVPRAGARSSGALDQEDRWPPGDAASRRANAERAYQPLRAQWDPTSREEARARSQRPERRAKRQTRLGRFASAYGWRAYAIPVLLVVTVLVVIDALRGGGGSDSVVDELPGLGSLNAQTHSTDILDAPPKGDGKFGADIASVALPGGGPFTVSGAGNWHIVPGTTGQVGRGTVRVFTYTVEVENGIDMTGLGGDEAFARMVDETLANPKSWIHDDRVAFRRIDTGNPDFRVSLTSQNTTKQACGYDIPVDTSCYNGQIGRVVINEVRWVRGAVAFEGDIGSYRQYEIDHEVGHAIGYGHQPCETDGGLAPVMMEQTFGTANDDIAKLDPTGVVPMDGKVCRYNPWPYPRG
nr:DUF3152 domain-containing protein [Skermania sp. ID1734]